MNLNLFQKSLEDIIKGAKNPDIDLNAYNAQVLNDVKEELKSKDINIKMNALRKIFYFINEGIDVKFASFPILDCMSSSNKDARKLGYMFASMVLDPRNEALIMTTHLFKKEITGSDNSIVLSCMANILTKDTGNWSFSELLTLLVHNKPHIRNKTAAILSKLFKKSPELITEDNLKKIIQRLQEEKDGDTLATLLQIVSNIIDIVPQAHSAFIVPLYDLLCKLKNNWSLIKLVKLFDKMIVLEPRLKKKLHDNYLKILTTTSAKSLEYTIISTVLKFFKEYTQLYNKATTALGTYIDNVDPNLRNLGLTSLKQLLENEKDIFAIYYDNLIESFKKGEIYTKLIILEIFAVYMNKDNIQDGIENLLQELEDLNKNKSPYLKLLNDKIIETIINICKRDYYKHLEDIEWFLQDVLMSMLTKVKKTETANLIANTIFDLIIRVEGLQNLAIKCSIKGLISLEEKKNLANEKDDIYLFTYEIQENSNTSTYETIIQTILFLIGEYSHTIIAPNDYVYLLRLLDTKDFKSILASNIGPLEICLFKLCVSFAKMLTTKNASYFEEVLDTYDPEKQSRNDKPENLKLYCFKKFFLDCLELLRKCNKKMNQMYLGFNKNYYLSLIMDKFDVNQVQIAIDKNDALLLPIEYNHLAELVKLQVFFAEHLKPVHHSGQSLIQPPKEINFNEKIPIDPNEKQFIDAFERNNENKPEKKIKEEMKGQQKQASKDTVSNDGYENLGDKSEITEKGDKAAENNIEEGVPSQQKIKKEYKIITQDELPQGVTIESKTEKPEKKKKKKNLEEVKDKVQIQQSDSEVQNNVM